MKGSITDIKDWVKGKAAAAGMKAAGAAIGLPFLGLALAMEANKKIESMKKSWADHRCNCKPGAVALLKLEGKEVIALLAKIHNL